MTKKQTAIASKAKAVQRSGWHTSPCASSWLIPCCVALASFLAFLPILQNGFVNGDDPANILDNPNFRGLGWTELRWMFTTFHLTLYRPLTWVTLGMDYLLWGLDPAGYHLTSLILHVVNAVLFYFLSLKLLSLATKTNSPVDFPLRVCAGFAALVFALHPLRVEPVAWVSARNDVLAGCFSLASILCYLKYATLSETSRLRWLTAAATLYGFSLLSKGSGVTLPIVLMLLDIYPLKRLSFSPKSWIALPARAIGLEKLPFFILACGAFVIGTLAKGQFDAVATLDDYGLLSRLNQILFSLTFYIWKTLVPSGLSPLYEKLAYITDIGTFDIRSGVVVLSLTVGLFSCQKTMARGTVELGCVRSSTHSGPGHRAIRSADRCRPLQLSRLFRLGSARRSGTALLLAAWS